MASGGKLRGAGGLGPGDLDPDAILRDCEAVLRRPDTDWDAIYLRLRCSALSSDFPRERFLRTPVSVITRALEYIDSEEKRQHNVAASTTAKLCLQVIAIAHGMAGAKGKAPKLELKDFLPFPDWTPENVKPEGPSDETRRIMTSLLKQGLLPMGVYAQLITAPDPSR